MNKTESDKTVILNQVGKIYANGPEKLHILRGIGFDISKGETIIITGESGSGKSTLLNLIGGLDYPSSGSIDACNMRIDTASEEDLTEYRNKYIGFIFQFHYLLEDFSALENVMLPAFMGGVSKKEALEKAEELLREVRLTDRKGHYPSQLSGGERQRVAVARALVNSPSVILADEPTGNLDEDNSKTVQELLFSLAKRFSTSMVLVTHDTALTERGDTHYHLAGGILERR
ncbi:MAG: ABC transporter ATP-binding protein [Spirochaetaceae bacterium]